MFAVRARWDEANNMSTYLKEPGRMPDVHQFKGGAIANGAFLLGLTNRALAANAYMNPWIHVQTDSQYYAVVENGSDLIIECDIHDLFNRKGHEFVDLNVAVYRKESAEPVMSAVLRAIYRLRDI